MENLEILVRRDSSLTGRVSLGDLTAVQNAAMILFRRRDFCALRTLVNKLDSHFLKIRIPEQKASLGRIFISMAIEANDKETLGDLLNRNLDLRELHKGQTVIHQAVLAGDITLLKMLVEAGANIHMKDRHGNTAIMTVMKSTSGNKIEVVEWLLNYDPDCLLTNPGGKEPIHVASTLNADILELFVKTGSDVDAQDIVNGDSPLHLACARCNHETVTSLIFHGSNINSLNFKGETPLVKLLLYTTKSSDFHTKSRLKVAKLLIEFGGHLGFLCHKKYVLSQIHRKCLVIYDQLNKAKNVASLEHLSRLAIRNSLGNVKEKAVVNLPLPQHLKHYILFRDSYTAAYLRKAANLSTGHLIRSDKK